MRSSFLLTLLLFLCTSVNGVGQDHPFYVYGEIWDQDTRNIIVHSTIRAVDLEDTTLVILARIDSKGRYDLELPFDRSYRVEFDSPGYLREHVLIHLQGVDPKKRKGDHGINIQASLIRPLDQVDYSPLIDEPFAICRLNKKGKSFVLDEDHHEANLQVVEAVLAKHTARREALGY